jgi:two-component system response regulator AtoC
MSVILVVDDEQLQRDILNTILSEEGYEVHTAASGEEATKLVKKYSPEIILTDLKMEGMDGIALLDSVSEDFPVTSVIIMTAYGTISSAVESIKKGAFDYLTKPLNKDSLIMTVKRAAERSELLKENLRLQKTLYDKFRIEGIVGKTEKMRRAIDIMRKVASSSATVLIRGESGTGKELVAHAIHYNSPRRSKSFTALNCASIPENLFESELFGYEPGAFTGAVSRKIGLFEATNGGTLFLDEIGDLPLMMQSKFLRILQDKEIRRLGAKDAIKVDVRIITATNKDIEKQLSQDLFREDLYYRLKVVSIELPPLRERKEDIPDLLHFFLNKYNREFGKRIKTIEPDAIKSLSAYHWPGNIRQLESVIERAVILGESDTISLRDIIGELRVDKATEYHDFSLPDKGIDFEALEENLLKQAMEKSNGVVAKAAKLLGMSYKTFWYRWEKLSQTDHPSKKETLPEQ